MYYKYKAIYICLYVCRYIYIFSDGLFGGVYMVRMSVLQIIDYILIYEHTYISMFVIDIATHLHTCSTFICVYVCIKNRHSKLQWLWCYGSNSQIIDRFFCDNCLLNSFFYYFIFLFVLLLFLLFLLVVSVKG